MRECTDVALAHSCMMREKVNRQLLMHSDDGNNIDQRAESLTCQLIIQQLLGSVLAFTPIGNGDCEGPGRGMSCFFHRITT